MSKLRTLTQAGFFLALLLISWLPVLRAQSLELPVGPAQGKVLTSCTECHDASIILQQRLSKAAWMKEVDKMTKWGAVVDPAERDSFIDYLSSNFPPERPQKVMPRTVPAKSR